MKLFSPFAAVVVGARFAAPPAEVIRPLMHRRLCNISIGLCVVGSLLWGSCVFALEVPALSGRVVDGAGLLSPEAAVALTTELAAHEQRTGNQVVVLTIPSLEGESLEEYSHRVATTWKLGQKGVDNGVLLLIASQDRKIRIEVGYGLEGTLTDAKSAQIIRREMVPRFRAGDFPAGIEAGVKAILSTIEGTYEPKEDVPPPRSSGAGGWEVFILAVFIGIVVGTIVGGQWKPGGVIGSVIAFIMSSPLGVVLAVVAAVLVLIIILILAGGSSGRRRSRGDSFWPTSGWGGTGGGDFSGGGFSGGGGDFGGGGASGRW